MLSFRLEDSCTNNVAATVGDEEEGGGEKSKVVTENYTVQYTLYWV